MNVVHSINIIHMLCLLLPHCIYVFLLDRDCFSSFSWFRSSNRINMLLQFYKIFIRDFIFLFPLFRIEHKWCVLFLSFRFLTIIFRRFFALLWSKWFCDFRAGFIDLETSSIFFWRIHSCAIHFSKRSIHVQCTLYIETIFK